MVVQVGWPGATVSDTLQQITDRLERQLEETPEPGSPRRLHHRRPGNGVRQPEGLDACARSGHLVSRWARRSRHPGSLPQGVVGPGFNDEFGDTTASSTASPLMGSPMGARDSVDDVREQLLELPASRRSTSSGPGRARLCRVLDRQLAGLGIDCAALIAALEAQTPSRLRAWCRRPTKKSSSASRARSGPNRTFWRSTSPRKAG